MTLIWATRGRTWGFRFLRDGGFSDPLPIYDSVFRDVEGESRIWHRMADMGALRFPDPLGRRDRASRTIPHDFVVLGPMVERINSIEDGVELIWPLVAEDFARVVELPKPSLSDRSQGLDSPS